MNSSMSYCLVPACSHSQNPDDATHCQRCGAALVLGDRYRAVKLLGWGGFGRTFLAIDLAINLTIDQSILHPSTLQSTFKAAPTSYCVIKQFFPPIQPPTHLEKAAHLFDQEAAQLAQLGQHPSIPKFLAHFKHETGQYLIQSYIDGQTLAQELEQTGRFDDAQIRQILSDLLPVLQFIHDRQVIHRDIKPANIIRQRHNGQLVLVDFGASKFATHDNLAKTGTTIGSAGFAAPEQLAGKATFASDIYSLGVTCLHLLTQIDPFDLYSFMEGKWIWREYLQKPVDQGLGIILDRMVVTALNQRYASAAHVLHDLTPHEPIAISQKTISQNAISQKTDELRPLLGHDRAAATWHCVNTLVGHSSPVAAIAIHPNGRCIASSGFDRTIKLWKLDTGEFINSLVGHEQPVLALNFNPRGTRLISGGADAIRIWQLQTDMQPFLLANHGNVALSISIALTPDGLVIASGSDDCTIKIWQARTGRLFRTLVQDRAITAIAIASDGQTLISGSSDNCIRLWNLCTGEWLYTLVGHRRDINSVAISADDQILASGSSDHTIKLWDLPARHLLCTLTGHMDWVKAVAISPNGEWLASGSSDHTIKLWHLSTKTLAQTLIGHTNDVNALAFSPNGKTLVSGSSDRTLKVWQLG